MTKRVAITGIGAVTPVGNDADTTWTALCEGRSGVGRIMTFDVETFPVRIAGSVTGFDLAACFPEGEDVTVSNRAAGFGIGALREALAQAEVRPDTYAPAEKGVILGCHMGRPEPTELAALASAFASGERVKPSPQPRSAVVRCNQNNAVNLIARLAGCGGPVASVSTACAASAQAIGEAFRRVQDGEVRLIVTGGYDSLVTWLDVLGFARLGALATEYNDDPQRASRPFDAKRTGFVLGEGGVIVILEEWESARARGAHIQAELLGYGSSMNAYRMTDAPPDGGGTITAMSLALADAGLGPGDVDYVVAHGTGTPSNDLCETVALKAVFGADAHRIAISSPKSMTGHLTAAAGALNLLAAVRSIRDHIVSPTINLEHPDPKLDLDYVANEARRMDIRAAMVNAFAFGGTNASLVLRGADPT